MSGLTARQAEVLGRALADALAYRKERAGAYCAACEREYGGLCYDHAGDEMKADEYRGLTGELGALIEAPAEQGDTARLAAIREVLAHFDWEFHDRQLALERIEQIAGGA